MADTHLTIWLSCRRDALLLTLGAVAISAWGWTQPFPLQLTAGVVCALLYIAALGVVRQAWGVARPDRVGLLAQSIWGIALFLTAGATIALLTSAIWDALGNPLLTGSVALLAAAWQGWLFFWTDTEHIDRTSDSDSEYVERSS